jgi:hypothetical protein
MQQLYTITEEHCLIVIDLHLGRNKTLYEQVLSFDAIFFNEDNGTFIGLN